MIGWEMIDLHGILSLAASIPGAFIPEAFEAMAILTESKVPGAENYYRKVMQAGHCSWTSAWNTPAG